MGSEFTHTLTDSDFLQTELDLSNLDPEEFEKLVMHLIDEMGFSNTIWRKGGPGNSATDGGRDLEAAFWEIGPARSNEKKYWFEVKFRSGQLEKSQVQNTVLNASGNVSKDHLVIVTNSTISNPCVDWLTDFRNQHKLPEVTVWQGHDLELLLRKNPRTLSRFLPTSLAISGRIKVIESRLFNLCLLPSLDEVIELWRNRSELTDNTTALFAAVLAEAAFGDLVERPWGMDMDDEVLLLTTVLGIANIFPLIHRALSFERSQEHLISGLSYLIECVLVRNGAELATRILYKAEELCEAPQELPAEIMDYRVRPILGTILDDLAQHCSSLFCLKLHYDRDDMKPSFFARFDHVGQQTKTRDGFLVMNNQKEDCKLGLVDKESLCPLGEDLPASPITEQEAEQLLEFARRVILQRNAQLQEEA